jgi:hypothetical protein
LSGLVFFHVRERENRDFGLEPPRPGAKNGRQNQAARFDILGLVIAANADRPHAAPNGP